MPFLARISHEHSLISNYWGTYRVLQDGGDLAWANSGGAPLLDNHQSRSLSNKHGSVQQVIRNGLETLAVFTMDATPEARQLHERLMRREIRFVSMGFEVSRITRLKSTDDFGADYLVAQWQLSELSLVLAPADRSALILDYDFNGTLP